MASLPSPVCGPRCSRGASGLDGAAAPEGKGRGRGGLTGSGAVSAPPRLTWLRLVLTPRGERRPAHGPARGSLSPVGTRTRTRTHIAPARRPPRSCPRPAAEGRAARPRLSSRGEARAARGAARREEDGAGACPGTTRRGLRGAGARRQGQARQRAGSPDVSNLPAADRNLRGPREGRSGAGRAGGEVRGGAAAAAEPGRGSPPSREERLPLPLPPAEAAALSMAATVGWQGKETWSCTTVARISTRA